MPPLTIDEVSVTIPRLSPWLGSLSFSSQRLLHCADGVRLGPLLHKLCRDLLLDLELGLPSRLGEDEGARQEVAYQTTLDPVQSPDLVPPHTEAAHEAEVAEDCGAL